MQEFITALIKRVKALIIMNFTPNPQKITSTPLRILNCSLGFDYTFTVWYGSFEMLCHRGAGFRERQKCESACEKWLICSFHCSAWVNSKWVQESVQAAFIHWVFCPTHLFISTHSCDWGQTFHVNIRKCSLYSVRVCVPMGFIHCTCKTCVCRHFQAEVMIC